MLKVQYIPSKISTEVNSVILRELVIRLGIEIVEKIIGPRKIGLPDQRLGKVKTVGSPATDQETAFILYDRPFEGQPGRNQTNSAFSLKGLIIPFFHLDVKDRRQSASIDRGNTPFDQGGILYSIGVENAKKTKEMAAIIDDRFVEQDEVLISTSSPHIKS